MGDRLRLLVSATRLAVCVTSINMRVHAYLMYTLAYVTLVNGLNESCTQVPARWTRHQVGGYSGILVHSGRSAFTRREAVGIDIYLRSSTHTCVLTHSCPRYL